MGLCITGQEFVFDLPPEDLTPTQVPEALSYESHDGVLLGAFDGSNGLPAEFEAFFGMLRESGQKFVGERSLVGIPIRSLEGWVYRPRLRACPR